MREIYGAIKRTSKAIQRQYPEIQDILPDDITFVTTQELEDRRPDLTPKERELEISRNALDLLKYDFHRNTVNGNLPLTIGGGIGQSRLCMFLLQKAHIGEVQSSVWPQSQLDYCKENGINLL